MNKQFAPGEDSRRGKGGKRKGSGRKLDWLKAEIEKIGDPCKVIQYLYDVNQGKAKETIVVGERTIEVPAPIKDRIRAGEAYLDRRMGKVSQTLDLGTGSNSRLVFVFPESK